MKCTRPAQEGKNRCSACIAANSRYYERNKEAVKARATARREGNREENRAYKRSWRAKLKAEVFALLGGKCAWLGCDWIDSRALQIDHKNGDGNKERANGIMGTGLLRKVLKDGGKSYQLLCANHNWIKRVEQGEVRNFAPLE